MKFDIMNRWNGNVQFSAEIECAEDAPTRIKIGLALQWGYQRGTDLSDTDLRGAVLRDTDLSGADLRGAVLRGADLSAALLSAADLRNTDLSAALLSAADLRDTNLRNTDLRNTDLRDTDLSGADLSGADLRGADLRGAVLRDTDLSGADLREYKVDGNFGIVDAGAPNHWSAFGYVEQGGTIRVRVGCRHFEIGEGRIYWSRSDHRERQNRREVLAALDYIEAVMRLRGWSPKLTFKIPRLAGKSGKRGMAK